MPAPTGGGPAERPPIGGFTFLAGEEVLRTWLFTVDRATCADPDGTPFERYVVRHPGAVAVVPVDRDGTVTLVRQLRPAVWAEVLEIPAGTRDVTGEPLESTARRELAEEAGLEAAEMQILATTYNSPGFCDQATTIYLATGLTRCATGRIGEEERWMSVERVPLSDVESLVAAGRLKDQTTIAGLYMARALLAGGGTGDSGGTGASGDEEQVRRRREV